MDMFVDIETRATTNPELMKLVVENVTAPSNYKDPDKIAAYISEARKEAISKTSLDGTYGEILTIGVALDANEVTVIGGPGETEHEVLTEFACMISGLERAGAWLQFIAFNGEFDFKFIYQRMVVSKVIRPRSLPTPGNKFQHLKDPMKMWAGFKEFVKQQTLEQVFGIKRDDTLKGSEVGTALLAGDWDAIIRHNSEDVRCLREIYRRMV